MVWLFVLFVVFLNCTAQSLAADFSVVTRLFSSSETVPLGENTTIFQGDKVYDLPATGDQITFFDKTENQFVVVNTAKKTWTRISTEQLLQYTAWVKEKSMESDDPLLRFCAAPQFDVRSESGGRYWRFEHPLLEYRVETDTFDEPEIGLQYRSFSDWYARLNTMLQPQSLPPFPRLIVNQQIAQKGLLPRPSTCGLVRLRALVNRNWQSAVSIKCIWDFLPKIASDWPGLKVVGENFQR